MWGIANYRIYLGGTSVCYPKPCKFRDLLINKTIKATTEAGCKKGGVFQGPKVFQNVTATFKAYFFQD